jgi:uncharacterized membrane protein YadS
MTSSDTALQTDASAGQSVPIGWRELWVKEDWWAVWLGLAILLAAYALFLGGASIRWLAVAPPVWSNPNEVVEHFAGNWQRYIVQFVFWLAIFAAALSAMGYKARAFVPSFLFLYVLSVAIFTVGQWSKAANLDFEQPLPALVVGLIISNLGLLPRTFDAGFRVEFYIKLGIVLLGVTLPFTLILRAGPIAILQASIVALTTFFVIYWVAIRLGIERRLAATLGVGGSVCGVSAAIAAAGAVGAKKDAAPITITVVLVWAIVMIFALPLVARSLGLPAGVAGAWIGTSEFADAAGIAAATAYAGLAGHVPGIAGTGDQALAAFTLMKVVGRDVWIGIWAFVLALVATTRWEAAETGVKPNPGQIWWRFPKFVIGFLLASLLVTAVTASYSLADYNKSVNPGLVAPIKDLRTWAFVFCFLSIGLTTRLRDLAKAGAKPFLAFTTGVVVNVLLGYYLSTHVFAEHWANLGH